MFSLNFISVFFNIIYFIFNFITSRIYWKNSSIDFVSSGFNNSKASTCLFPGSSIVFICFSNALPRGQCVSLACFIILLLSDGKIYSPVRYLYLSIFPDDNADIFAASLLISYCNFSSLILLSTVRINYYIFSKDSIKIFIKIH